VLGRVGSLRIVTACTMASGRERAGCRGAMAGCSMASGWWVEITSFVILTKLPSRSRSLRKLRWARIEWRGGPRCPSNRRIARSGRHDLVYLQFCCGSLNRPYRLGAFRPVKASGRIGPFAIVWVGLSLSQSENSALGLHRCYQSSRRAKCHQAAEERAKLLGESSGKPASTSFYL